MKIFTLRQRVIVYGITLATIAIFAGIGWLIGGWVWSRGGMTIIMILLSFPVTQYVLIKRMRTHTEKSKERGDYA